MSSHKQNPASDLFGDSHVEPIAPAAPYLGGKKRLADVLVPMIDSVRHTTYAEPFIGMGGIFFRRKIRPRAEVLNDINKELTTFFRILQRHYVPFLEMMRFQITTRAEFERLRLADPATLTDLERAARFIYLQRLAFGGKLDGVFGVIPARPARFDITTLTPHLEALHERLSGVVVECLPYADLIRRYDSPGTLFYLDPPYSGGETDYGKGIFERDDFARLAEQLAGIAGRFILSINDTPEIRDAFKGFQMQEVRTQYTVSCIGGAQDVMELVVRNC